MGVCIRCANVGVKDTFYGKGKQFCSANCVRGLPPHNAQTPLFKIVTLPPNKPKLAKPALHTTQVALKKKPAALKLQTVVSAGKKSPKSAPKISSFYTFDWTSLLSETSVRAAPISSFPHAPMADTWDSLVTIGLKLEVKNRDFPASKPNQEFHWIASVVKIAGEPFNPHVV